MCYSSSGSKKVQDTTNFYYLLSIYHKPNTSFSTWLMLTYLVLIIAHEVNITIIPILYEGNWAEMLGKLICDEKAMIQPR